MPGKLLDPFRITDGRKFRLADVRPDDTRGLKSKEDARKDLEKGVKRLADLQEKLYAQDQWGVLVIFQAMDAAGKDGAIAHVMSGVNPQGCQVFSFKAPSAEELDHDFLWRTTRCLPERGRIGIFNRSYYEEMLVVRVHPEILEKQRLPKRLVTKRIWKERFEDVAAFEQYPGAKRLRDREVLPARVEEGAERALPRAAGAAGEELEVLAGRREGTGVLGPVHGGVRGPDQAHGLAPRAVVRRPGRQQVVHPPGRGAGH